MPKTRPSINSVHNYLEGYNRMLEKQEFSVQESMFHANVVCFDSRDGSQGGHCKSFGAKNGDGSKANTNQQKWRLKQFLQQPPPNNQNTNFFGANFSKNVFGKSAGNNPVFQVCEKIDHSAQSCFVLRDLLIGKGPRAMLTQCEDSDASSGC